MNTIKLYWSYFRNILGTLLLIWPIFLAAWVFHLAMGLGDSGGMLLGLAGAGAVLVFFRSYWGGTGRHFSRRSGDGPARSWPICWTMRFARSVQRHGACARTGMICAGCVPENDPVLPPFLLFALLHALTLENLAHMGQKLGGNDPGQHAVEHRCVIAPVLLVACG